MTHILASYASVKKKRFVVLLKLLTIDWNDFSIMHFEFVCLLRDARFSYSLNMIYALSGIYRLGNVVVWRFLKYFNTINNN